MPKSKTKTNSNDREYVNRRLALARKFYDYINAFEDDYAENRTKRLVRENKNSFDFIIPDSDYPDHLVSRALQAMFETEYGAALFEANGDRYYNPDDDTILLTKDQHGNSISPMRIKTTPLHDIIRAAKKVKGSSIDKALALAYTESTFGINPHLRGFLGRKGETSKEDVTKAMNENLKAYNESDTYNPAQLLGLDHIDPDNVTKVNTYLSKLVGKDANAKELFEYEDDGFGGRNINLTRKGEEYFGKRLNNWLSEGKLPNALINGMINAENYVESYDPTVQALKYFQKNPVKYNSSVYKAGDAGSDINKMSDAMKSIIGLRKHNPELDMWIEKNKRYGGAVKTLKGRRKRYDLGGARDNVNNVTGSHWGAAKGIQGAETKRGLTKGLGIGSTVGAAAGSIVPGVGTAIGGVIGGIIGGVSGLISGIFGGRRKKRKAREAAIRADITKNYELGQDDIRIDQQALNDITINTNPIDIYGDNPIPTGNTQTVSNQYNMIGVPTKENYEFAFRCGGRRKRYADGGSINQVASNAAIVEGPSHEQGGVPYGANAEVEGGEAILNGSNADYIFSDTLKLGNRTFADIAKPLMLHKGYLEDKLAKSSVMLGGLLRLTDRSTYAIDRNTNARNTEKQSARYNRLLAEINGVQAELNNLYNQQEAMKAEAGDIAEPKQEFALGGSIFACGGRRKYPTGGLAIPPLQSIALTPQLAEMDIQTVSPITSTVNTGAMSGATMGANIIANFMAQDAMNKRQAVVSGLPPHIKDAVLSEVGMRCGGRVKKADGGSVQVSPFSDLNIQVDNPTKQMINSNPYLMTPMILRRCGGKTKRYDLGGFISDESGNLIGAAGNLIGSLMQGRSKRKLAKSISDMPIPKREYLDNVNLEWDINTDAARREVIDQISAIEDFVKSNSSSAPVARQAMLRARSKGASALGKLKQDELMQELNIRNQARQMNSEIAAKNKQIKYENEVDAFEKANLAASLLAEGNTGIRDALVGLTGDVQKMLNDYTLLNDKRNSNILHLLSNDKSIGFLKNLSDKQISRLFGKDAVALKGKRCGGKVKKRYGGKRCA
ncbi:receptor tyrosine kinase [uncultured phage cr2_1]|uniref:Receptor tyrosine kinase n=1 Tax=uncultured phage cr2_1 TaxID=2986394 RepID=A0AAE7RX04_9CAUD|nr:receptor tyrosine kinase [uncultured phage cr2_1]QWM90392.1 receptor tyrosine kinase [uncultured phage cr2_1]